MTADEARVKLDELRPVMSMLEVQFCEQSLARGTAHDLACVARRLALVEHMRALGCTRNHEWLLGRDGGGR